MIKKIPFNPVTAMAAWLFPSDDGVFYLLFMRDGTPVQPYTYYEDAGTKFPFIGQYWKRYPDGKLPDLKHDHWQADGRNLQWMTSQRDLVLFRGEWSEEFERMKMDKSQDQAPFNVERYKDQGLEVLAGE